MQHEVITQSGAIIRYDADIPGQMNHLHAAVKAFGGEVAIMEYNEPRESVLTIMDQRVVGTTLTDSAGTVYTLTPPGWIQSFPAPLDWTEVQGVTPSYEDVVSATMPGGWSWSRQYETYESEVGA